MAIRGSTSKLLVAMVLFVWALSPPVAAVAEPPPAGAGNTRIPQPLLLKWLVDRSTFTLVDARSADEYRVAHVDGAINLPYDSDVTLLAQTLDDRAAPLVIYCKSGKRAALLRDRLSSMGYSDVRVLWPDQLSWTDGIAVFNCGMPELTTTSPATILALGREEDEK